jgi:uncharacterized integral membrane protein
MVKRNKKSPVWGVIKEFLGDTLKWVLIIVAILLTLLIMSYIRINRCEKKHNVSISKCFWSFNVKIPHESHEETHEEVQDTEEAHE